MPAKLVPALKFRKASNDSRHARVNLAYCIGLGHARTVQLKEMLYTAVNCNPNTFHRKASEMLVVSAKMDRNWAGLGILTNYIHCAALPDWSRRIHCTSYSAKIYVLVYHSSSERNLSFFFAHVRSSKISSDQLILKKAWPHEQSHLKQQLYRPAGLVIASFLAAASMHRWVCFPQNFSRNWFIQTKRNTRASASNLLDTRLKR